MERERKVDTDGESKQVTLGGNRKESVGTARKGEAEKESERSRRGGTWQGWNAGVEGGGA